MLLVLLLQRGVLGLHGVQMGTLALRTAPQQLRQGLSVCRANGGGDGDRARERASAEWMRNLEEGGEMKQDRNRGSVRKTQISRRNREKRETKRERGKGKKERRQDEEEKEAKAQVRDKWRHTLGMRATCTRVRKMWFCTESTFIAQAGRQVIKY